MGMVVSIVVGAIGAILRYATNVHSNTWNVPMIGDILMIVAIVGFILSVVAWAYWDGFGWGSVHRRRTVIREQAPPIHGPDGRARTTCDPVVVQEEEHSLR